MESETKSQALLVKHDRDRLIRARHLVIRKYEQNDIPPPKVKTDYPEFRNAKAKQLAKTVSARGRKKVDFTMKTSKPIIEIKPPQSGLPIDHSSVEISSSVPSKLFGSLNSGNTTSQRATPERGSLSNNPSFSNKNIASEPIKQLFVKFAISKHSKGSKIKVLGNKKHLGIGKKKTGQSNTCRQEGLKLIWMTRGQGVCADDNLPLKKFTKPPSKMPRIALFDYLRIWDMSSSLRRYDMLKHFLKSYASVDPLDLDYYLSHGGTLIFSRFTIGMQIAFQRRKPVWMYFQALGVFIKSLQGERFMYEFIMMGGMATAFEVLRVDEMSYRDKTNVFYFLYRLIDGQGGTRVKQFICRDTSSLESVVDCLTMCKNSTVIKFARVYLHNLCFGNTMGNLHMISRYVTSMLTCDFNPPLQQMACQVLIPLTHQNGETARYCYSHLVDVLRTEFAELLVDVGDLAIAIMATSVADDFLVALNNAAQPSSLTEDLALVTNENLYTPPSPTSPPSRPLSMENPRPTPTHDTSLRQQYGALYVLSYMLKNRTEFADWMVEKGVIGSLLAAIGTSSYTEVQLSAIRLLLLIHELSPDCAVALAFLLPRKLLVVILDQEEGCLAYLTAVMCTYLRRLGRLVEWNWAEWFDQVVLPKSTEDDDLQFTPIVLEISSIKEALDELIGEYFSSIIEKMELPIPDSSFFEKRMDKSRHSSRIVVNLRTMPLTPGELRVLQDDDLEPFRKYLHQKETLSEPKDDFDQYYAGKYTDDTDYEMGGMEMARLRDAEKALAKYKDQDPFKSLSPVGSQDVVFTEDEYEIEGESESLTSINSTGTLDNKNESDGILQI